MEQGGKPAPPHAAGDITEHVGYRLKRAAAALRGAMDRALREHGLTVPQYSCLELLDERPGISGAELARSTFVTRQSSSVVLRGLQEGGLVTRPAAADHGRALPVHLTEEGKRRLTAARAVVYAVEQRMIGAIPDRRLDALLADLDRMADALDG
ncbi:MULTISPECIES: MarR family winged helix-turn-helix transcriptional regulator [Streptosporangium]|uniref:DNA-binding MarR family transcriptional regulator n=1 Tax=Streptosporangium brasiliense TaxID=47480 RepID=A0ABT9RIT1_9ACTN|nr:MarR family transcriptional regulator [Streptosporangium brasiliense]MDP9869204.1 DNA-binding MarR family transcriptional regulator [Streptosporangium brasiliense]